MILLDTNVIVHYIKGDPEIALRIRAIPRSELAIPAIAIYELEYGTLRSKYPARRRFQLNAALQQIQRIPFDSNAAMTAANIRLDLEKQGALIGPMDVLIAGTALSRGALLITNNTAEFSRVRGLRIADWKSDT